MAERTIVNRILRALRERDAFAEKIHGDAYQSRIIDIIACYRGVFIGIECKRPGERLTKMQSYTISEIVQAGGRGIGAWDEQDVTDLLDRIDKELDSGQTLQRRPITDHRWSDGSHHSQ